MRKILTMMYGTFMMLGVLVESANAQSISPQEAEKKLKSGQAIMLDVREAFEIKDGMAKDALWLATSDIGSQTPRFKEMMSMLPKDKEIILYCRSGRRAEGVQGMLQKLGFKTSNLGAFNDWKRAGMPVKVLPDAKPAPCPYLCLNGG